MKIQVWLKTSEKPVEIITDYFWVNEAEVNNVAIPFVKIRDNIFRKDDILRIVSIEDGPSQEENTEGQQESKQGEQLPF